MVALLPPPPHYDPRHQLSGQLTKIEDKILYLTESGLGVSHRTFTLTSQPEWWQNTAAAFLDALVRFGPFFGPDFAEPLGTIQPNPDNLQD